MFAPCSNEHTTRTENYNFLVTSLNYQHIVYKSILEFFIYTIFPSFRFIVVSSNLGSIICVQIYRLPLKLTRSTPWIIIIIKMGYKIISFMNQERAPELCSCLILKHDYDRTLLKYNWNCKGQNHLLLKLKI